MSNVDNYLKFDKCYGCTACQSACVVDAIKMEPDHFGFLYPIVNASICVHCNKCIEVCPIDNHELFHKPTQTVYAFQTSDDNLLKNSQSGGAFSEIAKYVITKRKGVVYGCAQKEDFSVGHIRINNLEDLYKIQGSKYTQSNLQGIILQIKEDIQNNLFVLFSGLPCQVAAIRSVIGENDNLFCVDLLCHGVMPPFFWGKYINYITQKKGQIEKAIFRNKEYGWNSCFESFYIKGKIVKKSIWRRMYFSNYFLRPSCYSAYNENYLSVKCFFTRKERVSDITVGDFWGIDKIKTNIKNTEKGVSIILINTEKGKSLIKESQMLPYMEMHDVSDAYEKNIALSGKDELVKADDLKYARRLKFETCLKKYGKIGIKDINKKIRKIIDKL